MAALTCTYEILCALESKRCPTFSVTSDCILSGVKLKEEQEVCDLFSNVSAKGRSDAYLHGKREWMSLALD